jgi:hypothetical protein
MQDTRANIIDNSLSSQEERTHYKSSTALRSWHHSRYIPHFDCPGTFAAVSSPTSDSQCGTRADFTIRTHTEILHQVPHRDARSSATPIPPIARKWSSSSSQLQTTVVSTMSRRDQTCPDLMSGNHSTRNEYRFHPPRISQGTLNYWPGDAHSGQLQPGLVIFRQVAWEVELSDRLGCRNLVSICRSS